MNHEDMSRFVIQWVDARLIQVPAEYQRQVKPRVAARIARSWDWGQYRPIELSRRVDGPHQGQLFVVDGQHRLIAAMQSQGDDVKLPALIKPMTIAEEAERFARQNENQTVVNARETFKADLVAGEPSALEMKGAIEAAGFFVATESSTNSPNGINAIRAIRGIYNVGGSGLLGDALVVIREAYPVDIDKRTDYRIIGGVAYVLAYYPEVALQELIARLQQPDATPSKVLQRAGEYQVNGNAGGGTSGLQASVGRAVLAIYNKRRSGRRVEYDPERHNRYKSAAARSGYQSRIQGAAK